MEGCVTFFNSIGKLFVEYAGSMLIQSGVLILVLLVLDVVLRRRVRAVFRYCMWMLVLVKLILPVTLSSPTGAGYWVGDKLYPAAERQTAVEEAVEPMGEAGSAEVRVEAVPSIVSTSQSVSAVPSNFDIAAEPTVSLSWQGFALLAWLAAVLVMILLLVQRAFFVRGLVAQSGSAGAEMLSIFEQCQDQIGFRGRTRLKSSQAVTSPSVCGLFRPTILIPQGLVGQLKPQHLKSILLHELAHIKRGDLWVSLVQTMLQIVYFYNPLLWVANAVIRRVREQAVDEMVLVAMSDEAEDYPGTLLNISKLAFNRPALSLRLIGVVESKKALVNRIKHILSRPFPKTAKLGIAGILTLVIAAVVLLPMAGAVKKPIDAGTKEWVQNLVEDFFKHNYRDITARKTIEWGEPVRDANGNVSIRYKYEATIWDKDKIIENKVFTFDKDGKFISVKKIREHSIYTKAGAQELVEEFFKNNYRDITARKTIEWGEPVREADGNVSIRYKYEATIWDKDKIIENKVFTFDKDGEFVSVKKIRGGKVVKKSQFTAALSNGVRVELVGVCEHPSKDRQWRRPDGSLLDKAPYEAIGSSYILKKREGFVQYEFAMRLLKGPRDTSIRWHVPPGVSGSYTGAPIGFDGKRVDDLRIYTAGVPKGLKSAEVSIGLSADVWQTLATHPADEDEETYNLKEGAVAFGIAYEKDGRTMLPFVYHKQGSKYMDVAMRVAAVNHAGQEITGSMSGSGGNVLSCQTYSFRTPLGNIKEFRFQTRPYQWITFKNVSLKPKLKTDVQIEAGGGF